MKALYVLVPLGLAAIGGCTTYRTTVVDPAPARVAYVAPAPAVVTVSPTLLDSDGDGVPNATDRYPADPAFR